MESTVHQNTDTSINFEPWHQLLTEYVTPQGQVDYRRWKAEESAITQLKTWLTSLEGTHLSTLPQETRLALLINLYNAVTINQVLDKYPIDSVRPSLFGVPNLAAFKLFFSKPIYQLGVGTAFSSENRKVSLDNIEHDLIRKQFAEPRIHFALVCASFSCPILRNEAYRPSTLEQQLTQAAQGFINDTTKNRYDTATNTLYCSKIFQWYEQDFLAVSDSIPGYFQNYFNQQLSEPPRVKHLPYDWTLNGLG